MFGFFTPVGEIISRHQAIGGLLRDDVAVADIHRLYSSINDKSASLFGHVSLMVAACTFLANLPGLKPYFLVHTFAYLVIALLLLPVLNLSMYAAPPYRDPRDLAALRTYFARSIRWRRSLLKLCLVLTMSMTLAVLATLGIVIVYGL